MFPDVDILATLMFKDFQCVHYSSTSGNSIKTYFSVIPPHSDVFILLTASTEGRGMYVDDLKCSFYI
jgi:hypothetical protein